MKLAYFYLICFFILSCASERHKDLFSISFINEQEYKPKQNASQISFDTSIKKTNGIILIPFGKGSEKVFKDKIDPNEEESIEYKYLGKFNAVNFSVLEESYWEGGKTILVDNLTGETYDFWSTPIASPENKKFASFLPNGLEGEPVGVQVFKLDTTQYNKFTKLIQIDQLQWDPQEIYWANENTLHLKVKKLNELDEKQDDKVYYIKIELNDFE